jgi:hypothetical protein
MATVSEPAAVILHAMKNDLTVVRVTLARARREGSVALLQEAEQAVDRTINDLWKLVDALWPDDVKPLRR